tara:strand:- start:855 stop:1223 length:369 start_codon:yes stop_codon:yes gene_type:complete
MNLNMMSLDLSVVIESLQNKCKLSECELKNAQQLYVEYLTLRSMFPDMLLSPPSLADMVWHEHLNFHDKYEDDCYKLFGKYLTHYTGDDDEILELAWKNTKEMYANVFGKSLPLNIEAGRCR